MSNTEELYQNISVLFCLITELKMKQIQANIMSERVEEVELELQIFLEDLQGIFHGTKERFDKDLKVARDKVQSLCKRLLIIRDIIDFSPFSNWKIPA